MRMTSTWAVSFVHHQHRLPDPQDPPSRLEYDTKDRERDGYGCYAHENEKTEPPLPQHHMDAHFHAKVNDGKDVKTYTHENERDGDEHCEHCEHDTET